MTQIKPSQQQQQQRANKTGETTKSRKESEPASPRRPQSRHRNTDSTSCDGPALPSSTDDEAAESSVHAQPDSPDIYDDLKVHQYEDQGSSNSPFDLYSDIKSNIDDELIKHISSKDSPNSDADFLYSGIEGADTVQAQLAAAVSDGTGDNAADDEITQITSTVATTTDGGGGGTNDGGAGDAAGTGRSDAGTPVMDEPSSNVLGSKASPGSTPEARTPLLDEPEYNFEPVKAATDDATFPFTRSVVPDETAPSKSQTRNNYLRAFGKLESNQQKGFESISPPSSPESADQSTNSKPPSQQQQQQQQQQVTSPATFPFSALALKTHSSRSGSRSGSSCHSPLPPDERSPRTEKVDGGSGGGGGGNVERSWKQRSSGGEGGGSPHSSHSSTHSTSKRDSRRSGSQSSSSSFSKSPEYEFSKQRNSHTKESGRSSKHHKRNRSPSPGYDSNTSGSYNKRSRK